MWWNKQSFMGWEEYKQRIDFIDDYFFRQQTRAQSVKNLY